MKLLPYILFEKMYLYFSIGNGPPSDPALCPLYRHTFVPYAAQYTIWSACGPAVKLFHISQ